MSKNEELDLIAKASQAAHARDYILEEIARIEEQAIEALTSNPRLTEPELRYHLGMIAGWRKLLNELDAQIRTGASIEQEHIDVGQRRAG